MNLQFNFGTSKEPAEATGQKQQKKKHKKRSRRGRRQVRNKAQIEPIKHHDAPMTKSDLYFALDCEMVGVGDEGFDSAVARVTLVNWDHKVVLDTFVKVPVPVKDFRTHVSGIRPEDILREDAMSFTEVSEHVARIIRGKILIGHGLENDLCALGLTHPWCDVRDTAHYAPFMQATPQGEFRPRKLRDLAWDYLSKQIQVGGIAHSPMEDAITALDLYKCVRKNWEEELSKQQMENIKMQEQQEKQQSRWWNASSLGFFQAQQQPPMPEQPVVEPVPPMMPQQFLVNRRNEAVQDPYGLGIPGFSPLPDSYVEEARAALHLQQQAELKQMQEEQQADPSQQKQWFWRRPRSPSPTRGVIRKSSIPKFPTLHEEEEQSVLDSPKKRRSYALFFGRQRSSAAGIEPSTTQDTDDNTSIAASSVMSSNPSIWAPVLDEAVWTA